MALPNGGNEDCPERYGASLAGHEIKLAASFYLDLCSLNEAFHTDSYAG